MKKLFVALDLPPTTKSELLSHAGEFAKAGGTVTEYEDLHVTLNFFGKVFDEKVDALIADIEKIAEVTQPFALRLTELIYAPMRRPASMVWGVFHKNEIFDDLTKRLGELNKTYCIETPRFHEEIIAHVTLARLHHEGPMGGTSILSIENSPEFTPKNCFLYETLAGSMGVKYRKLEEIPFKLAEALS